MNDEVNLNNILLKEQLEYYRLQRHDCLNHGQVIMGYLQLGKTEKALQYLRGSLDSLGAEQMAGQIPQTTVAAIILGLILSLRKEGIPVEFYMDPSLKKVQLWEEFWREEYGQALYGYTKEWFRILTESERGIGCDGPDVYLTLRYQDKWVCQIQVMQGEQTVWEKKCVFPMEGL